MTLLIVSVLCVLVVSALCSVTEAALYAVRPSYVRSVKRWQPDGSDGPTLACR